MSCNSHLMTLWDRRRLTCVCRRTLWKDQDSSSGRWHHSIDTSLPRRSRTHLGYSSQVSFYALKVSQFDLSVKNYMVLPHHYQIFVQFWGQIWGTWVDLVSSSSHPAHCSGPSTWDGSKGSSAAGNASPGAHDKQNQNVSTERRILWSPLGK